MVFPSMLASATNRSQFFRDLTIPFYGFNRPGAKVIEGLRESFWLMGMQGGIKGQYDCIRRQRLHS
jgi:non-heme chloroperoxidase